LPKVQFIPDLIQQLIVNPNPVKAEGVFMQHNIDATLDAYDLKNIKTVDMTIKPDATDDIVAWGTQKHFENIPVWDTGVLIHSYRQLQEIRPYYKILAVDEDRYNIVNNTRQVNLAAREVDISKLPSAAQNWENSHLRYTHGFGAVISPAAQDADSPLVWFLHNLSLDSDVGFSIKYPDIYYGEGQYGYAIVPNNLDIEDISRTDPNMARAFSGDGGIPIASLFRKALFSIFLKDEKIFFSRNINRESKLKIRRNITERISIVAPFLHLDKDPYLVLANDRMYWIQDAFTLSNQYPISKPADDDFLDGHQQFNYIRNSVKVIVDAYDGDVEFYVADPSDAIIQAYSRAYPGLLKPLDEMPVELRKHLRYPRDLYYLQMKIYARYHQRDPALFYEQAETWSRSNVRGKPVMPYYQTMDFGNCNNKEEFVMVDPMTPINRENLSMIGVAGIMDETKCGLEYKPGITVYRFGRNVQVNGPAQVEALVNQDPLISEQFTLWDQGGSRIEMGRMITLPMGNNILYVQPVYIAATNNQIPQLIRVIVSIGNEVVMDRTLWLAFNRLKQIYAKRAGNSNETGMSKAIADQGKN
jgi:uncharacterized membrane protein (UPF0182 family)